MGMMVIVDMMSGVLRLRDGLVVRLRHRVRVRVGRGIVIRRRRMMVAGMLVVRVVMRMRMLQLMGMDLRVAKGMLHVVNGVDGPRVDVNMVHHVGAAVRPVHLRGRHVHQALGPRLVLQVGVQSTGSKCTVAATEEKQRCCDGSQGGRLDEEAVRGKEAKRQESHH